MDTAHNKRVFLSYAHDNLEMVYKIYDSLIERKVDVWFDKENMGPGLWKRQIEKAIPQSRYFVICISDAALKRTGSTSPGFQDEELQQAYEIARNQPDDLFTIIPVRIEDCGRGDHRLSVYQQYDLFNDFEKELDHLAVNLGGVSLTDKLAEDTRTEDDKIKDGLMGKANTIYYAGDFNKAYEIFNSITTLFFDYAVAWHNKGIALWKLGRLDDALVAFNKVIELEPDSSSLLHIKKGLVLEELGRHEDKLASFDKAVELEPDSSLAWHLKALALSYLDRDEDALAAFDKVIKLEPDNVSALHNKGFAFEKLGRHEDALAAFDKVVELEPDSAFALHLKAMALGHLGRDKESLETYNKAIMLDPNVSQKTKI